MTKLRDIILDGIVLVIVSSVVVGVANFGFGFLEGPSEDANALLAMIDKGDLEGLHSELQKTTCTGTPDAQGRAPLAWAAYANLESPKALAEIDPVRKKMTTALLAKGEDPDSTDHDGWTPLMWAAWSGLPKVAAELLDHGASPDRVGRQGHTALTLAAMRGNSEVVRLLLEHGANPDTRTLKGESAADIAQAGPVTHPDKRAAYEEIVHLLTSRQEHDKRERVGE